MEGVDYLINNAFRSDGNKTILRQNFEARLDFVGISVNQFLEGYDMTIRSLNSILDGNFKVLDPVNLLKISNFLNISSDELLNECIANMPAEVHYELEFSKKRTYILENFNLQSLKKDGVINNVRDFVQIEKNLLQVYGIKSIYDYSELDKRFGLFSSIKATLKDPRPKKNFKNKAIAICALINNDHLFHQDLLKEFFPRIRAYSLDLETGLLKVIYELYKIGINVVLHPSLSSSGARGITIQSNGKPSIVLTDNGKKYSGLWFTLIHELYHIVFDWEDICAGRIHVTDDDEFLSDNEIKANEFARDYMFPSHRLEEVSPYIDDPLFVKEYAIKSNVHYSIVYDNYCYNNPDTYPKYNKYIRIPWQRLRSSLIASLSHSSTPAEYAHFYQKNIFNNKK